MAHYEMADILSRRARLLGVPVILLASLIGTSAFASVAADVIPTWSRVLVGILSITAAVFSSLQTFLGYADRAEKHRVSGARFGSVRRKLENVYARSANAVDQQLVDSLREELDNLAQEALHVPAKTFKRVQEKILYDSMSDSNPPLKPIG
jgi:hypothetical protein